MTEETTPSITVGYVGGGSRNWALTFINDLAQVTDFRGTVRLYDIDEEAAERNARFGNWVQDREDAVSEFTYTSHAEIGDALDGADFVVCSTQPDPAKTRVPELNVTEEYGHYHAAAGGSVGPGGIFRGMREIPNYREIAAAVREHCPDAWVLQYSNPMTMLTRTMYREYPDINVIGLCHGVFSAQRWLASLVEKHWDVAQPSRREIEVNVSGINHFTWTDAATWRGRDLFPLVEAEIEEQERFPPFEAGSMDENSPWDRGRYITMDLYRRYGVLTLIGDRHIPEFAPQYLRVDSPEELHRWGVKQTPHAYYLDSWNDTPDRLEATMAGDAEYELTESGEEFVDLVRALLGLKDLVTNVNYPNVGQMPGVREGAVVETNARISENSVRPITADSLPEPVTEQIRRHVSTQETLVRAAFDGDLDEAFRAFRNDPQLVAYQPATCENMFRDLVATSQEYLDDWDHETASILE